jgi:hypothetical protein
MNKTYAPRVGASETTLADGRVMVIGEEYELSTEDLKDEHNKRLIDSRQIVEVKKPKKSTQKEASGS